MGAESSPISISLSRELKEVEKFLGGRIYHICWPKYKTLSFETLLVLEGMLWPTHLKTFFVLFCVKIISSDYYHIDNYYEVFSA